MSEGEVGRTAAEVRRSRWPGWIWAIPLAAIAIVAWLGLSRLARGGEEVQVLFDSAHGLKPGSSPVVYRGMKVGEVESLDLTPDGRAVTATLHLDGAVDKYLRAGTRFWLVGARLDLANLGAIKYLLSGPEVEMEPGSGAPARRFRGLDQPPPVPGRTPGTAFRLTADRRGSLQAGSPVYYRGEEVGVIESARLAGPRQFAFEAFVRAPWDRLVRTDTRFWDASAVRVSMQGEGLQARLVSPQALFAGAAAFDTPADAAADRPASPGERFPLWRDRQAAAEAPLGPTADYLVRLDGPVGALAEGAPVKLRGFQVGRVLGRRLVWDARRDVLETPVQIELDAGRLGLTAAAADPRAALDALLGRLVAHGLRARLVQDPPLVGGREVDLDTVPGARRARLIRADGQTEIPAAASGDLQSMQARAGDILARIDAIPFAEIGADVRAATARLRALVASPELRDSLDHIDSATAELDRVLRQAGPQVAPTVAKLRQTADRIDAAAGAAQRLIGGDAESQERDLPGALHALTEAARSVRALADYLERHPEALIKGKPKEQP